VPRGVRGSDHPRRLVERHRGEGEEAVLNLLAAYRTGNAAAFDVINPKSSSSTTRRPPTACPA
jgi:hypothetical protein